MKPIIPDAALQQHVAVLGKTRSGKSSVLRGLVEGLLERELPVCIVDPKGDWWGIKLAKDGKRPGYPVVIFGGEHADVPINAHAGAHVAELFATGNRPCLIDLGGWMVGERTRFYIDFASTLFRLTKGMRWLVVDEVHNFAPKGKVMDPDAGKALHWTNRLASEGLGKGLPMLFASQRPQKVHNDTLTSAETLIAMRVLHPSDRGAVSDWIKGCGDLELGAKVLASLAQMDRGEGWVWSPEIGLGPERVKFPMFKTYDSFRPQTAEDAAALKGWATVDLDEIKSKLAKVVQEAEANDPKLLRAEIAKLKAEHAKRPTEKVLAIDHDAVRAAEERGYARGRAESATLMRQAGDAISGCAASIASDLTELAAVQLKLYDVAGARPAPAKPARSMPEQVARPPRLTGQARKQEIAKSASGAEVLISTPQQRILDALAWLASIRPTDPADRTQLALLADQSPKSSGYSNNLGFLRSAGLIDYPGGGTVKLTDAGHAAARPPAAMPTTEDLHRTIANKVPVPQWRILAQLIEAYPDAVARDQLAELSGQSAASSGYSNNLGALRSLGFIDYPGSGKVAALPVLFING